MPPYFNVPLDIPHAAKVAERIARIFDARMEANQTANAPLVPLARDLEVFLGPYRYDDGNPRREESERIRQEAAAKARALVDAIEAGGLGADRLGQCIRNLFECLEMGEEGAAISLRAGENPKSLQRPV